MNLEQQTREADIKLLNQYEKELSDLENGIGLAKCMSSWEIRNAKIDLREAIRSFKDYLY